MNELRILLPDRKALPRSYIESYLTPCSIAQGLACARASAVTMHFIHFFKDIFVSGTKIEQCVMQQ